MLSEQQHREQHLGIRFLRLMPTTIRQESAVCCLNMQESQCVGNQEFPGNYITDFETSKLSNGETAN